MYTCLPLKSAGYVVRYISCAEASNSGVVSETVAYGLTSVPYVNSSVSRFAVNVPDRGVFVSLSYRETLFSLYVESSWDEMLNFT